MSTAIARPVMAPAVISPNVTTYVNRKYESEAANSAAPAHANPPPLLRGVGEAGASGEVSTGRYYRQSHEWQRAARGRHHRNRRCLTVRRGARALLAACQRRLQRHPQDHAV